MARRNYLYLAALVSVVLFLLTTTAESSSSCLQTVTEASIFLLFSNTSMDSPTLHANLATATRNCENFTAEHSGNTGARFTWFRSLLPTTPDLIYYMGSWASVREHLVDFVESPIGRETVALLTLSLDPAHLMHWAIDQNRCNNRAIESAHRLALIRGVRDKDDGGDGGDEDCGPVSSITAGCRIDDHADHDEIMTLIDLDSNRDLAHHANVLAEKPSWPSLTNVTFQILERIDV